MTFVYGTDTLSRSGAFACPAWHESAIKDFTGSEVDPITGEPLPVASGEHIIPVSFGSGSCGANAFGVFAASCSGTAGDAYADDPQGAAAGAASLDPEAKTAVASVSLSGPDGYSDSDTGATLYDYTPGRIEAGDVGAWSFSAEVELCFEVIGLSVLGKPLDAPLYSRVRFFRRLKAGGTWSASVSYGNASLSHSAAIISAVEITDYCGGNLSCVAVSGMWHPGSGGATWNVTGIPAIGETWAAIVNNGDTASWSGGPQIVLDGDGGTGEMEGGGRPPKTVTVAGVVRAMEVAYPDALTINLSGVPGTLTTPCAGGSFSASGTQKLWSISATLNGGPGSAAGGASQSASENTYGPVSGSIDSASLTAAGDDSRQTRLLIRGKSFPGITFSHAASVTVDDCASLTPAGDFAGAWTSSDAAGIALDGAGGIALTAASGRTFTRDFTQDVTFLTYPILRVPIKADAASKPVRFTFGGKWWEFTTSATPGTYENFDIDLSGEKSSSATTSSHDTKWPVHRVPPADEALQVSDYLPENEGAYFGVGRTSDIVISGLDNGVVYTIDSISLVRDAAPTLDVLPAFFRGHYQESGSPTNQSVDEAWPTELYESHAFGSGGAGTSWYYARRFLLAVCGSQQVLEERDSDYTYSVPPTGATSITHAVLSLLNLAENINYTNEVGSDVNPGWSATVDAPADDASGNAEDDYYNEDLPAVFLRGGGAYYSGGSWEYGFDLALGALLAQTLFDEVDFFTGCVEWGHGPSGTIPMAAILGAGAHGAVRDTDHAPESGVTVNVTETVGGAAAGSGTSAADGHYQSGTPFGKGNKDHTVTAAAGTEPTIPGIRFYGRKRHRAVFVVTESGGQWVSLDVSMTGRVTRAEVQSGEIVLAFLADPDTGTGWTQQNTGITGDAPVIAYDPQSAQGRLWITYVPSGGGIESRYTDNEGRTVSVAYTVSAAGTQPEHIITPTGAHHHYWRTSGGAIEGKIMNGQGGTLKSVTPVASGVADDDIAAVYNRDNGYIYLEYRDSTSDNLVTVVSSDGGLTFS